MLYFVAPEWWKPRKRTNQYLTVDDSPEQAKRDRGRVVRLSPATG